MKKCQHVFDGHQLLFVLAALLLLECVVLGRLAEFVLPQRVHSDRHQKLDDQQVAVQHANHQKVSLFLLGHDALQLSVLAEHSPD